MNTTTITTKRVRILCGGESRECDKGESIEVIGELLAKTGLDYTACKFEAIPDPVFEGVSATKNSDFGATVIDQTAKERIDAQHAALAKGGIKAGMGAGQFFANGTRMADVGYQNQQRRAEEHSKRLSISDAMDALSDRVKREDREDVEVSAAEFGRSVVANGKVKAFDLAITEQAMRGLCQRTDSPAIRYLLGLRDRIACEKSLRDEDGKPCGDVERIRADYAKLADTLRHECNANPDARLKLRTRRGVGDIFAIVSPSYTPADAPEVIDEIRGAFEDGVKGSWAYDPISTTWELRAHIWTPTPVADQAVGEPFEGYGTFQGRDNGTMRFRSGGGVTLLRCLNASTYVAEGEESARRHTGNVMANMDRMAEVAGSAINVLTEAWGVNREAVLEVPKRVTIEDVIPGFWRHLLTDRRSELAGVLPGRSEKHVRLLSQAFEDERRDPNRLVRSDLAQGWTRYVQDQEPVVRRNAEKAIGDWLVSGRKVGCDVRSGEEG